MDDVSDLFLVMSYHDFSLWDLLKKQDFPFTEDHVKVILYNLANALNYIHKAGLMHRDIKPGNILVDQECAVYIADFGMARLVPKHIIANEKKMLEDLDAEDFDMTNSTTADSPEQMKESDDMLNSDKAKSKYPPVYNDHIEASLEKQQISQRLLDDREAKAERSRCLTNRV